MIYGLYLSTAGAKAQTNRLDVVANNIANASTTGFRRQFAVVRARESHDVEFGTVRQPRAIDDPRRLGGGVHMYETPDDFDSQGPIQVTGRPYDLAVHGRGFFQVRRGQDTFLTRNGAFSVDETGRLVTNDRQSLLLSTEGNPIRVDANQPLAVHRNGDVYQGPTLVGQVALVSPEQPESMTRQGDSLFRYAGGVVPADGDVEQGTLEGANVNPVEEMIEMIETSRAFDININMIQLQNDGLAALIESVPRLQ